MRRSGRPRPKTLQAVYAVLVIAADGIPRSLWEASENGLADKGKGGARELPLELYVFR